jgi:lipid-binding SYLF domain-containing protein
MLQPMTHHRTQSARHRGHTAAVLSLIALLMLGTSPPAQAATATEINARVNGALQQLYERSPAARELGAKASGILVFPRVIKAGFGLGGEFGEGALLVGGTPVQYYRVAGASVGFQIGGQARSQVLMFMTDEALAGFQTSNGWEVGVDGSVALVEFGVGEALTSHSARDPIIGFVFGNKGLMYNLSLEGSRFWKVDK